MNGFEASHPSGISHRANLHHPFLSRIFLIHMVLDLERFRATSKTEPDQTRPQTPPRHEPGEWFVKGPIPGEWLSRAAALPGKSLHVALAIWYLAGRSKCRTVKLTRQVLSRFGVLPDANRRALQRLESAALVTVKRSPGRAPIVTIEAAPRENAEKENDSNSKFRMRSNCAHNSN
jgi:DNA-binding MarR family transcriptional regulator